MKTIEIQGLIDFIAKSGLEEVNIETEAIKIHIKRSLPAPQQLVSATHNAFPPSVPTHAPLPASTALTALENNVASHYVTIKSPMIGTFYRSPDPESLPFVELGDTIAKGTKLCIIEAMKLYNEIEAEVDGKIVKILVDDISPVEYDQPLFLVDPF
ncbi:acetyl-CoA carboxylase biotin carboxyl carrier protein [Candidatus Cardinium hertigii]|jgi:acetyl-CoA carboxylase biotin carboxyl carrier protein|uniref:Biotin carboxyl carrier protein of acetyl-CoA carboxylase n=1 Tax=Candidatus Cardinium hertigii TaxID=247481 RepID=A0A3N2QCX4_9BACT|nr:acetyl-CoA carboxylase biotin carboxyl carrier protein [Candidatus Cardinium hertigii]ROT47640.1 acetyl-CoA carboxylase biotin carboxyl carrier protein [Candidatus Cardinium hertigii]